MEKLAGKTVVLVRRLCSTRPFFFRAVIFSELMFTLLIIPTLANAEQVPSFRLDTNLDTQRIATANSDDGSKVYASYIKWVNVDTGNSDVFFTVISKGGHAYSAPVDISNMSGRVLQTEVATSSNYVYIAWAEQLNPQRQENNGIFLRTSDNYGKTFGPAKEISMANETGIVGIKGFIASGSDLFIAIADLEAGDTYFRASHDNGNTFDPPINLTSDENTSMQLANGKDLYVFATKSFQIFASHDEGRTFHLAATFSGSTLYSGSIFAHNETIYAVWAANPSSVNDGPNVKIFLTRSVDSGKNFSEPVNVGNSTSNSNWDPHVASDGANVYVVWFTSRGGVQEPRILFRASNDSAQTFGPIMTVGSDSDSSMLIDGLLTNKDNATIVWLAGDPQEVFLTQASKSGHSLQEKINLSAKASGVDNASQSCCVTATNTGSSVYVFWLEYSGNEDSWMWFTKYPPEEIAVNPTSGNNPGTAGTSTENQLPYLPSLMILIVALIVAIFGYLIVRRFLMHKRPIE